jgi:hypothetical protein
MPQSPPCSPRSDIKTKQNTRRALCGYQDAEGHAPIFDEEAEGPLKHIRPVPDDAQPTFVQPVLVTRPNWGIISSRAFLGYYLVGE